jgi:hypothetical protein
MITSTFFVIAGAPATRTAVIYTSSDKLFSLQMCDTSVQTGSLSYSDDLTSTATVKTLFIFALG